MNEEAVDGQEAVAEDVTETEEVEVETPEPTDEPEAEAQDVEADDDEETEDEEPAAPIEVDFGGNKVTFDNTEITPEAAEKVQEFAKNIWADYTRKSQDVAEKTKSIEAREGAVDKMLSLNNETLDMYSRGLHLRSEIEQLSQIDLNAMWQSDPDRARRVSDTISQKQAEFQQTVNQVSQKEAQLSQAQQAEMARRKQEGEAAIERQVKGFKTEKLPAVIDYAVKTLGMDPKAAESDWALNPAMTVAVHKAMLYDQMQATAKSSAKPKPAQAQPLKAPKPKGQTRQKLDLVKDADKMSADEWTRRRNAELAKKAS
jgi:hypothetical protein